MNNAQIGITCRAHWGLHISWHNYKILTTLDGRTSSTALMSIPSCSRSHSIHSNSPRVAHRWMRAWPSPTCVEIKWLRKQSQQTDTFRFARFFRTSKSSFSHWGLESSIFCMPDKFPRCANVWSFFFSLFSRDCFLLRVGLRIKYIYEGGGWREKLADLIQTSPQLHESSNFETY